MVLAVFRVNIPAMSTVGYGVGMGEDGKTYQFVGDHRPMRDLGEAVARATTSDELPTVTLEAWQITSCVPPVS